MGFFSKKEDIPKIPVAPTLPEIPAPQNNEKKELPELPSFPSTSENENLNQEIVRSAVSDDIPSEEKEENLDIQNDIQISEEPGEEFRIPPRPFGGINALGFPSRPSIADLPKRTLEINSTKEKNTKEIEPIFVRIDKFQSAQKNFEQIKIKVREIESIIGKITDIKSKEEVELKGWSEDIEKIKARLSEIDLEIFDQI